MYLPEWKVIASSIGVLATFVTLVLALLEFMQQGRQKRADAYIALERSFWEEAENRRICELLESGDPALASIPFATRMGFLGFYEEVALMLNSRLIREEVAHYMFGYFAIKAYDNPHFWKGEDKADRYWSLFRDFAERMKAVDASFRFTRKKMRF
jgi:hypothetical protein